MKYFTAQNAMIAYHVSPTHASIGSSDTEFSNTGSSECGTYEQNVNIVDEIESECDDDIFDE